MTIFKPTTALRVQLPLYTAEFFRAEVVTDSNPTTGDDPRWYVSPTNSCPDPQASGWLTGEWESWNSATLTGIVKSPAIGGASPASPTITAGEWYVWLDVTPGAVEQPIRLTHILILTAEG